MILTSKHEIPWTDEEPQTNAKNAYVCALGEILLIPPKVRRFWRTRRFYAVGILVCFCTLGLAAVLSCWYSLRVSQLIGRLGSPIDGVREQAAEDLREVLEEGYPAPFKLRMEDARAIAPLMAALKDPSSTVRDRADEGLVAIGTPAIEPLITTLKSSDPLTREIAAHALCLIAYDHKAEHDEKDRPVVAAMVEPLLSAALKDSDPKVRQQAGDGLTFIGAYAIEPTIAALKDKESNIRRRAASILLETSTSGSTVSVRDPRAVQPLLAALRDRDMEVIAVAYDFYIVQGVPGSEDILVEALNKIGDIKMAWIFLNSDNSK